MFFTTFFFSVGTRVKASQEVLDDLSAKKEESIRVSAAVSLTGEFSYLIRKNSEVILKKNALVVGEEGEILVSLRGGKGIILKQHRLAVRLVGVRGGLLTFFGETDGTGKTVFHFKSTGDFLGKNTIQVVDMTYHESLILMNQPTFVIFETKNAREKAENERKFGIPDGQLTELVGFIEVESPTMSDFMGKSVTMEVYHSVEAISRAGPLTRFNV